LKLFQVLEAKVNIKEYIIAGLKFLVVVMSLLSVVSAFFYNSRGLVSRKTLVISYLFFILFAICLWLLISIIEPSLTIQSMIFLGACLIIVSVIYGIKYLSLPFFKKIADDVTKKLDK